MKQNEHIVEALVKRGVLRRICRGVTRRSTPEVKDLEQEVSLILLARRDLLKIDREGRLESFVFAVAEKQWKGGPFYRKFRQYGQKADELKER